jgi:lambda family phage minor tail protein L
MTVPVSDLQQIAPSAVIELFELEFNTTQHGFADTYRFHAGVNLNNNGELVWNGNNYLRFPIEADGFEYSGNGQLPRPKIRVSNILGTVTALILTAPTGLEGAKFTRIRTLARYIDATNFPGGVSPYSPDPTAEFPREIYYVDRKTAENRDVVEYELAAAFDLAGVRAPKRQCIANICQWEYRSTECGYTGPPVATIDGTKIAPSTSPEATAFYAADANVTSTKATLDAATVTLNNATNTLNAAQGTWVLQEVRYNPDFYNKNYVKYYRTSAATVAFWGNVQVTLGSVYRQGALKASSLFEIQRWAYDTTAVTNAQNAYNSALSAYNTALSNYNTAVSTRASALTAWQAANFTADIAASNDACGKRLSDCKLRYNLQNVTFTEELPFGSFPGIGTYFT